MVTTITGMDFLIRATKALDSFLMKGKVWTTQSGQQDATKGYRILETRTSDDGKTLFKIGFLERANKENDEIRGYDCAKFVVDKNNRCMTYKRFDFERRAKQNESYAQTMGYASYM